MIDPPVSSAIRCALSALVHRPVVVELGCHNGDVTNELVASLDPAMWYAWECDPRTIEDFRRCCVVQHRVELVEAAVSDVDGTAELHMSGYSQASTIMGPGPAMATAFPWLKYDAGKATVRTRRLDSWCAEKRLGDIDFVWCDVEGAEGKMLAGAELALPRIRFMFMEVWDGEMFSGCLTRKELIQYMGQRNWSVLQEFSGDVLFKNNAMSP